MVLDPRGAQGEAQETVGQLPGGTGATVDMTDQDLVIMLARHPLEPSRYLPGPGLEQFVAWCQGTDGRKVQALHLPVVVFVLAQLELQDLDLRAQRETVGIVVEVMVGHAQAVFGVGAVVAGADAQLPGA